MVPRAWVITLGLILSACSGGPDAEWITVEPLATPAGTESLAPRLAADAQGRVLLSWLEAADHETYALRYAWLEREGWSQPTTVAQGRDWFVNWADTPAVQPLGNQGMAAHWLTKSGPDTYAYDVVMRHSTDGGASWSAPFSPHHDGTRTEHGFVSLFPLNAAGAFGALWLDGRNMSQAGHAHEAGAAREGMTLRFASFSAEGVRQEETLLDALTCDCCPTNVARAASGWVAVYRDRSAEEIRDIYITRRTDTGWSTPQPVHEDNWRIPGCPVNGPVVAADGDSVAVAWFTAANDQPQVRLAFSDDGGETFSAPVRIDEGLPLGRVAVVWHSQQGVLAAWLERTGARSALLLRRVSRDGTLRPAQRIVALPAGRASGFPQLILDGGDLIVAWTDAGNGRRVRAARLVINE